MRTDFFGAGAVGTFYSYFLFHRAYGWSGPASALGGALATALTAFTLFSGSAVFLSRDFDSGEHDVDWGRQAYLTALGFGGWACLSDAFRGTRLLGGVCRRDGVGLAGGAAALLALAAAAAASWRRPHSDSLLRQTAYALRQVSLPTALNSLIWALSPRGLRHFASQLSKRPCDESAPPEGGGLRGRGAVRWAPRPGLCPSEFRTPGGATRLNPTLRVGEALCALIGDGEDPLGVARYHVRGTCATLRCSKTGMLVPLALTPAEATAIAALREGKPLPGDAEEEREMRRRLCYAGVLLEDQQPQKQRQRQKQEEGEESEGDGKKRERAWAATMRRDGVVEMDAVLPRVLLDALAEYLRGMHSAGGAKLSSGSSGYQFLWSDHVVRTLNHWLTPVMEAVTGEALETTKAIALFYEPGSILDLHVDGWPWKWALSIAVESDPRAREEACDVSLSMITGSLARPHRDFSMVRGQGLAFLGYSYPHYREPQKMSSISVSFSWNTKGEGSPEADFGSKT